MNFELAFSAASLLAMAGWLVLLASPLIPIWSDRIAGLLIPMLLSVGYFALLVFKSTSGDGGFSSLTDVMKLFSHQQSVLAAWVHFLALDLLIGAWACRVTRRERLNFWLVVPCLFLTFMFGPVGFLAFSGLRFFSRASGQFHLGATTRGKTHK